MNTVRIGRSNHEVTIETNIPGFKDTYQKVTFTSPRGIRYLVVPDGRTYVAYTSTGHNLRHKGTQARFTRTGNTFTHTNPQN